MHHHLLLSANLTDIEAFRVCPSFDTLLTSLKWLDFCIQSAINPTQQGPEHVTNHVYSR